MLTRQYEKLIENNGNDIPRQRNDTKNLENANSN